MTPRSMKLFYVNRPDVTSGKRFTDNCPSGGEKTVVLGCYVGNDRGIYIYNVSDSRLEGVEKVTAAHEMLHAAYRRLGSTERKKVDTMLTDYYQNGLTDKRIESTIEAYRKSEPNDVVNEMHSIFGTEVANLPAPLEVYYRQYFKNRAVVARYTADYQSEFTTRRQQVIGYDEQLRDLNNRINAAQANLVSQRSAITVQRDRMDSEKASNDGGQYNSEVLSYNTKVDTYNVLLSSVKAQINQYNTIVEKRNAIALEEQQLVKELSSSKVE